MGYCMYMTESSFFVPSEHSGLVMSKMKGHPYQFELDGEGNIVDVGFLGEKLEDDFMWFQSIAPYVRDGSCIEMTGEEGERWRWVFENGKCEEVHAHITWPRNENTNETKG